MPLRCRNPLIGLDLQAFDLSADEWRALAEENRQSHHLRLPCCAADVVLKKSQRGTQFFAHKAKGNCTTAPESEAHLRLKQMAVTAARANGWEATTEVRGATPDGEQWIADVLALKGAWKVAVEIQWSGQTDEETLARHARYAKSGVRGLWLLRQATFHIGQNLPAARVVGDAGENYRALLPNRGITQEIPMTEFLDAAFGGRLKFGMPQGFAAQVSLWANDVECWSCHRQSRVITRITLEYGPYSWGFMVPDLTDHREVFDIVRARLPTEFKGTAIKDRYSRMQERSYLSNGCGHCDALFGEFFEIDYRDGETKVGDFVTSADAPWCRAIAEQYEDAQCWGVYQRL
jgi:competence protein CoiA